MSIASALRQRFDGEIIFLSRSMHPDLKKNIVKRGFRFTQIPDSLKSDVKAIELAASSTAADAIVIDSYNRELYEATAQSRIRDVSEKLIYIAFDSEHHYLADVLHNQNPLAITRNFSTESYTKRLFGLDAVVLRPDVRNAAKDAQVADFLPDKLTLLVTFGSSDPNSLTEHILQSLEFSEIRIHKIMIIVGALFNQSSSIEKLAQASCHDVEVMVNPPDLIKLMTSCDLALTSGGTTNWELGALGRPIVILPIGPRESESAQHLADMGWAQAIYDSNSKTRYELGDALRLTISHGALEGACRLRSAINIDGVERLVDAILE
ncbi:hypothetical protein [Ectothiorhodospira variabilis]|uniref:hypothetical protein n=1 Tax=Ectothiorhodospira variabilis TaxID=505694 RepID=UPI001EFB9B26|nr:hypothetical protein [Ectothiorhodospira variabilis]MCG5495990.1 hypothetical protein [Ectothiorhodospira variabilis]MCG5505345.1 hypothetical protein [Ectothiorhodospira variabilis]MCG5508531.1 hypothetical protein [Ectothiorhodospira variabilis]